MKIEIYIEQKYDMSNMSYRDNRNVVWLFQMERCQLVIRE